MKKIVMLMFIALALTGCNTMQGFGKDMQTAGEKIENRARK